MATVSRPIPTRIARTDAAAAAPAALLASLAAGEPEAMERIVERFRRVVYSAARRVLRNSPDVEDVVQDTWLALAANATRIRNPDRLAAWLWATATNAALAVSTRQRRQQSWDCDDAPDGEAQRVEDEALAALVAEQRRAALYAALATISAEERELIGLLVATARPCYREVSKAVGRPVGSLGPTRLRILAKLRAEFPVADQ